ncbi:MarR family winged helix-turn-helix transcriptional regulator [Secundilactobacillus similis]|uniref:HTH-type transcriptional regulator SarZ n=1 Tax=Secundilactobacillus similis DSM 23365 = JCM 2765 TaxID=1423804 RepID=A0A0R2FPP3_9LACO|nr:MarR family transcriptional regulator [Secundilactobacillus similis]KRN26573.1 MarR family transcriptional regulator [Secundilactobacillus similis DSM 23365 = JCM 2765]
MATQALSLAEQLCFSVYNANRLFNQFYQQALTPYQLTYPQYLVLLALWERDQQAVHELADQLHLASNTLTPMLKRMEQAGWVTRTRPAEDQRQLIIGLTDQARDQQAEIVNAILHCIQDQTALTAADYERMLADNQRLVTELRKVVK